jgi:hypothetical protein
LGVGILGDNGPFIYPLGKLPELGGVSTPQNAALAGSSAVLNQYAQQILDSIKRDGFYVRVPAGKQFYLYVTQTIDLDNAKRGQSLVDLKPENQKP